MPFKSLELVQRAPFAEIRVRAAACDHPDRLLAELRSASEAIRSDDASRVVLIVLPPSAASSIDDARTDDPLPLRSLELLPQPTIAVIEGAATGVAFAVALACDIRVGSADASFACSATNEAAPPALGITQRLPRLIGRTRASEMVLLGERIDAATALSWGLLNAVAPRGEAHAHAEKIAESIAARGPLAVRFAKEAIARGLDMPLDQALRYETDLTVILQTTADRAEGVRAFIEKRPPKFEGK
jgi:enoyl-CoA hydratase/carnithine racemase